MKLYKFVVLIFFIYSCNAKIAQKLEHSLSELCLLDSTQSFCNLLSTAETTTDTNTSTDTSTATTTSLSLSNVTYIGESGGSVTSKSITADSSSNFYINGTSDFALSNSTGYTASSTNTLVAQVDSSMNVSWITLYGTGSSLLGRTITTNSTYVYQPIYSSSGFLLNLYNTSGSEFLSAFNYLNIFSTSSSFETIALVDENALYIVGAISANFTGLGNCGAATLTGSSDQYIVRYTQPPSGGSDCQSIHLLGHSGTFVNPQAAVIDTANSAIYVSGNSSYNFSTSTSSSLTLSYLAKYDLSGNFQWAKSITGSQNQNYGVALDSSGNVYITGLTTGTIEGQTYSSGTGGTPFVASYDSSGNQRWVTVINGSSSVTTYSSFPSGGIAIESDVLYVAGTTNGTINSVATTEVAAGDVFLLQIDTSGNVSNVSYALSSSTAGPVVTGIKVISSKAYVLGYTFGDIGSFTVPTTNSTLFLARFE
ncbi:MAG: SBBP repeat-containing protein [Spirochaetota bacterium]